MNIGGYIYIFISSNLCPVDQMMYLPWYILAQDPDASVQVSDLVEWEKEHGRIPDNALIMMSSGWDSNWPNASAMFGTDMSANVTMQVNNDDTQ